QPQITGGCSHRSDDERRAAYVRSLGTALRPGGTYHVLCFSDREPPGEGPRRVTREELEDSFRDGWEVKDIREARLETVSGPGAPQFSPGGPKAWLGTIVRR